MQTESWRIVNGVTYSFSPSPVFSCFHLFTQLLIIFYFISYFVYDDHNRHHDNNITIVISWWWWYDWWWWWRYDKKRTKCWGKKRFHHWGIQPIHVVLKIVSLSYSLSLSERKTSASTAFPVVYLFLHIKPTFIYT